LYGYFFSTKKDGKEREAKLMKQNEKMVIQLERNTTILQQIERSLAELGSDVQERKGGIRNGDDH